MSQAHFHYGNELKMDIVNYYLGKNISLLRFVFPYHIMQLKNYSVLTIEIFNTKT